jgi:hypothetical protein
MCAGQTYGQINWAKDITFCWQFKYKYAKYKLTPTTIIGAKNFRISCSVHKRILLKDKTKSQSKWDRSQHQLKALSQIDELVHLVQFPFSLASSKYALKSKMKGRYSESTYERNIESLENGNYGKKKQFQSGSMDGGGWPGLVSVELQ